MKNKLMYIVGYLVSRLLICVDKYHISIAEKKSGCKIKYVSQGSGGVYIAKSENFKIDPTSHIKSNTFIECSGGVTIGRYFHTGRGLTIFSSSHVYDNKDGIPYSHQIIYEPVIIKDFVWCGSNVTILPGITIGEGAIIGAESVVTKNIPNCAVVGGNPAKIIKYRNVDIFYKLKNDAKFF